MRPPRLRHAAAVVAAAALMVGACTSSGFEEGATTTVFTTTTTTAVVVPTTQAEIVLPDTVSPAATWGAALCGAINDLVSTYETASAEAGESGVLRDPTRSQEMVTILGRLRDQAAASQQALMALGAPDVPDGAGIALQVLTPMAQLEATLDWLILQMGDAPSGQRYLEVAAALPNSLANSLRAITAAFLLLPSSFPEGDEALRAEMRLQPECADIVA